MNSEHLNVAGRHKNAETRVYEIPLQPAVTSSGLVSTLQGEALQGTNSLSPFLCKTYDMVNDPLTDSIVSWSSTHDSFIVWNHPEFIRQLLPKYFKHNNFSSFVRQLNTYGFRKVDPTRWEFAAEGFLRGHKHLLRALHRRKPASQIQSQEGFPSCANGLCVEIRRYEGLEGDIEQLKVDKNIVMQELGRIRQLQQTTDQNMQVVGQRVLVMEQHQQRILSFLAKAMQSPSVLAHIVQQNEGKKCMEMLKRKTELSGDATNTKTSAGQLVKFQPSSPSKAILLECSDGVELSNGGSCSNQLIGVLHGVNQEEQETSTSDSELPLGNTDSWTALGALESMKTIMGNDDSKLARVSYQLSTESALMRPRVEDVVIDNGIDIGESLPLENIFSTDDEFLFPGQASSSLDICQGGSLLSDRVWQQFLDGFLILEKGLLRMDEDNCIDFPYVTAEEFGGGSLHSWCNKMNVEQLAEQFLELAPSPTGF